MAAESHASVAAKRASLDAAQADWDVARRQYFPAPSVQNSPGAGGGYATTMSVEQPLWTGGRLTANDEAARARTQSATLGVLEARQSLGFVVTNSYQAFEQARARMAVLRRFITRLAGYREGMQRRVDSGISAQSELDLLQARQAQAAGQLKAACYSEGAARGQLSALVARDLPASDLSGNDLLLDLPDLQDLLSRSQNSSPTLRRLEQDEQSARGLAQAKSSAQWPSVSLVAQRYVPHGVPNASRYSSVGLQVQYVPGAGFSSLAEARSADAQVEAIRANREAAQVDLESRIRTEYDELRSAMARREDGLLNAQATANVLASYERLFTAGKRSWLDVMNAARELSDAELMLADLEAQMTVSRYRLALFATEMEWMQVSR